MSKVHYGQPTFTVSYYISRDVVLDDISPEIVEDPYAWEDEPESCSKTCGAGGIKVIKSTCIEKATKIKVSSDHCKDPPPRWRTEPCELEDCPALARWESSEWGSCSANCGHGTATRIVRCIKEINGQEVIVSTDQCQNEPKPSGKVLPMSANNSNKDCLTADPSLAEKLQSLLEILKLKPSTS